MALGLLILNLEPRLRLCVLPFQRRRFLALLVLGLLGLLRLLVLAAALFLVALCLVFGLPARQLFRFASRLLPGFLARLVLRLLEHFVFGSGGQGAQGSRGE